MWETFTEFFASGEFWSVLIKALLTVLLTTGIGLLGTLIGKAIAKNKESKIYKYASTCVRAAEMKYPNEGTKMGPEKMAYVMDQLAIKFPKIKESAYFYNIAEAAVLELNKELGKEKAIKEFEEKYGEKPIDFENFSEEEISEENIEETSAEVKEDSIENKEKKVDAVVEKSAKAATKKATKLTSF